jgi:ribosome maturation factor RimP
MQEQEAIFADIEPLLKSVGLELIEFGLSRRHGATEARAMVYSPAGTGTNECTKAYRLIYPRLQVMLGVEDVYLEVSSPGIDRLIRSTREYGIFVGKGLRVLLVNETEWLSGRIESVSGKSLVLSRPEGSISIDFDAVAKARLDSTQEGD